MRLTSSFAVALPLVLSAYAQYFPPPLEGVTVVKSKYDPNVKITYKENDICEATEGVRSFTGHVHLPPINNDFGVHQNYSINTFFWFFEAREDPQNAPLSIWLNGGPGSSSMIGLFQENGPCFVNDDSNSTYNNPHSWNNKVNMLYIDQPNQVGFSYDIPTNVTVDVASGNVTVADFSHGVPMQNNSFLVGTFGSQDAYSAANNTQNAARSMWHFAQVWFQEFPEYKPNNNKISIWTESYGGRYGPAFASYFQEQNEKIRNHTITQEGQMHIINLDTLGIINGCIDLMEQATSYPDFAYNNTYGIQAYNQSTYEGMINQFYKSGGCRDKLIKCREISLEGDPHFYSHNKTVNDVCYDAAEFCGNELEYTFDSTGLGYYDISHSVLDPFPPQYFKGYLSQSHVLADMGMPVNYSQVANGVRKTFRDIGDYGRSDVRGYIDDLAYLLETGVKVALVYGDRDYICNWLGGEKVSLALNYTETKNFHKAGYADVHVNSSFVGGQVRQYGNFSFTRVYQAGHEVPSYQPEASLEIFHRIMFNKDIATGQIDIAQKPDYATNGTATTFQVKNEIPPQPEPTCYVLAVARTCTKEQIKAVKNGTAVVKNYVVKSPLAEKPKPVPTASSSPSASPTRSPSSSSTSSPSPSPSPTQTGAGSGMEASLQMLGMAVILALTILML